MTRTRKPRPAPEDHVWAHAVGVVASLAWVYPAALIASLYLTWVVAWGALGHRPIPSIDDPKSISPFVDAPYLLTFTLLLGIPAGLLIGLVGIVLRARQAKRNADSVAGPLALYAVAWTTAIGLLCTDPLKVGYWFMD